MQEPSSELLFSALAVAKLRSSGAAAETRSGRTSSASPQLCRGGLCPEVP